MRVVTEIGFGQLVQAITPFAMTRMTAGCVNSLLVAPDLIANIAARGYFGANVGRHWGGAGLDTATCGMLHEEIARGCSSVRSLLTVHGMVAHAIEKWGTDGQRRTWLPRLATGECICAFALTEPSVGSDAGAVTMRAIPTAG